MTISLYELDSGTQATIGPTSFMTERNEHEVRCGMCARELYVDDEDYRLVSDAMESGLENPVRCEVCAEL